MIENIPSKGVDTQRRKFNYDRLRKKDLVWLFNHRCVNHGMPYSEHPSCYFSDLDNNVIDWGEAEPIPEKVGFFDIETSNLSASFGYMFSYCIKELNGDIISNVVRPKEIRDGSFDRRLCKQLTHDLLKFDRIVVFWGKQRRFDMPYVRTRTLVHHQHYIGIGDEEAAKDFKFIKHGILYIEDLWDVSKNKLKLHNNRLQTVADVFDIPSKEHKLNPYHWQRAMSGNRESLDFILEHNKEDVVTTEACWLLLYDFVRHGKTVV